MVSPGMRKLLDDCLAENPTDRVQSFALVREQLRGVRKPRRQKRQPRLLVLRGLRRDVEYPLHEGPNYVGRPDHLSVDVNLECQEPPERIHSSRRHAVVAREDDALTIEYQNSSTGTFVNRVRLSPGESHPLNENDVIRIGSVHLQFKVGNG